MSDPRLVQARPLQPAGDHRPGATMISCTPEQCALCKLIPGAPECLRKQANKFMRLSKTVFGRGVHEALEKLSFELMDAARAIEKERAIPPAPAE